MVVRQAIKTTAAWFVCAATLSVALNTMVQAADSLSPAALPAALQFDVIGSASPTPSLAFTFPSPLEPAPPALALGVAIGGALGDETPRTRILLQHRFVAAEPTAADKRSAGHPRAQSWLKGSRTLYAAESEDARIDINLRGSRMLATLTAAEKVRGWSASVSQRWTPNWRISAELCGPYRDKETWETATQFFVAASYSVNKRMTFDAGIAQRVSGEAPDTTLFFAVSLPLDELRR